MGKFSHLLNVFKQIKFRLHFFLDHCFSLVHIGILYMGEMVLLLAEFHAWEGGLMVVVNKEGLQLLVD